MIFFRNRRTTNRVAETHLNEI